MVENYVAALGEGLIVAPDRPVLNTLFEEYEHVLVQSLVSAFGLDFLVKDQHGGDVDTVHNVRQIGKDDKMVYKNKDNAAAYDNRGPYDSRDYHHHPGYIQRNREISRQKKDGTLVDAYTGEGISRNDKTDLDHVMSAKEIHDDRGRVLAGLNGADLANNPENLQATNPHTNRSKKQQSMEEYLAKHPDEYTESQKARMMEKDARARSAIDAEINRSYYTGPSFRRDVAKAAGKNALSMGARQAMGLVFAELWFAVKDEFQTAKRTLREWLNAVGNGIRKGFERLQHKYKDMLSTFFSGAAGGLLSSITTTICNIFFTTAKSVVKCIREAWASISEAVKVLLINPDNYLMGDRVRAALKLLAAGASTVIGVIAGEAVGKIGFQAVPVLGEIVPSFVSLFTTGILSCTLLYVLDRSQFLNDCFSWLNKAPSIEKDMRYFQEQAALYERYTAALASLDLEQFDREVRFYKQITDRLESARSEQDLNNILRRELREAGISLPWKGDFSEHMSNPVGVLRFS